MRHHSSISIHNYSNNATTIKNITVDGQNYLDQEVLLISAHDELKFDMSQRMEHTSYHLFRVFRTNVSNLKMTVHKNGKDHVYTCKLVKEKREANVYAITLGKFETCVSPIESRTLFGEL